jgi:hypothetical protein
VVWVSRYRVCTGINGQHEDYNELRIKKGLKPLSFRLLSVERIDNPLLSARFDSKASALKALGRSADEVKVRWAFHGTRESALHSIATYGLLRVAHPSGLNPSKSTDPGYFGDPKCGVYLRSARVPRRTTPHRFSDPFV